MSKKKIVIILILLFIISLVMLTGGKRTDVVLQDFFIAENSTKITLRTMVTSSMGYVRKMKAKQDGDSQYLTFYSTYGINNRIGAKNTFELEINPSCTEIYFNKGNGSYQLVLQKNKSTNEWEFVQ